MRKQAAERRFENPGLLGSSDREMTAHRVIGALWEGEPDTGPPTRYRTLAAPTDQGRMHLLEAIKSLGSRRFDHDGRFPVVAIFDGCKSPGQHCGGSPLPHIAAIIEASAFKPERHDVEPQGHCRD
ncbi:Fur family transcriptional regulator [Rhodovulum sp. YNF3179]|uniref:Fur family transcriptional regulator n=1 Tax=Rhodovulum sp. YNF3179 TaxID=3425127 RepID=UPI003D342109